MMNPILSARIDMIAIYDTPCSPSKWWHNCSIWYTLFSCQGVPSCKFWCHLQVLALFLQVSMPPCKYQCHFANFSTILQILALSCKVSALFVQVSVPSYKYQCCFASFGVTCCLYMIHPILMKELIWFPNMINPVLSARIDIIALNGMPPWWGGLRHRNPDPDAKDWQFNPHCRRSARDICWVLSINKPIVE